MSSRIRLCYVFFLVAVLATAGTSARADRPSAMKLFPEETIVFVRMANANEFGKRINETGTGRMLRDPQMKPFVEQLYGDVEQLYADKAEEKLGIRWEDLKKLPHGEVAFGIVARPNKMPAFALLVDQGEESSVAAQLVDRVLELAEEKGSDFSTEEIGDVEVTLVRDAEQKNREIGIFERENTIVVATDPNLLRGILWHWDGGAQGKEGSSPESVAEATSKESSDAEDEPSDDKDDEKEKEEPSVFVGGRSLAENSRFATIVQNCRRPQDPPPQLLFFADPIEVVRNFGRDRAGVQFAMGLLPALGISGFQGVGGAVTYATDEYDALSQFHILLENPRAGVLQIPAFEPGETAPQNFVPHAVETYLTWNSNHRTVYDRIAKLVDQFRSEGAFDNFVKRRVSDRLGIDFVADVIDNLSGRVTWTIGYEKPAHFRGQRHVLAAALKDEEAAVNTLKKIMDKFPDLFEERHFGNATYYAIVPTKLMEMPEEDRPVDPCVAIFDGYLFLSGSCQLLERCIEARDGTIDRLVDSEDYARATAVLGREMAGTTPVMFSTALYEESVHQWYGLLMSERTRAFIDEKKGDSEFLASLAEALDQNKLPPFEALAPYLAPGGSILYDTDTGYHGIGFSLRNETE